MCLQINADHCKLQNALFASCTNLLPIISVKYPPQCSKQNIIPLLRPLVHYVLILSIISLWTTLPRNALTARFCKVTSHAPLLLCLTTTAIFILGISKSGLTPQVASSAARIYRHVAVYARCQPWVHVRLSMSVWAWAYLIMVYLVWQLSLASTLPVDTISQSSYLPDYCTMVFTLTPT